MTPRWVIRQFKHSNRPHQPLGSPRIVRAGSASRARERWISTRESRGKHAWNYSSAGSAVTTSHCPLPYLPTSSHLHEVMITVVKIAITLNLMHFHVNRNILIKLIHDIEISSKEKFLRIYLSLPYETSKIQTQSNIDLSGTYILMKKNNPQKISDYS